MRPTYPLSPVIHLLETAPSRTGIGEVAIKLNARTGEPVGPSPFAPRRYFLVRNERFPGGAQAKGTLDLALDPLSHGVSCDLVIEYRASCPAGSELLLAQRLSQGPSLQETFDSMLLGRARRHLAEGPEALLRDFRAAMAGLAAHLRERATAELGLDLRAEIKLAKEIPPGPISAGPFHFEVRTRDWDPKLDLTVEAVAEVLPGAELLARSTLGESLDLQPLLRRELQAFISSRVGLHELAYHLGEAVRPLAEQHLAPVLARYGLRLLRLVLACEPVSDAPRSLSVSHRFLARLAEYPKPVEVRTEMILELVEVRAYLAVDEPDLETWAQEQAEEVTRDCLFGVKFLDLCKSYEERKERIKRAMKEKAGAIGYEIRQLLTITDLPIDTLARPFPLELREEEFSLNWEQVKAKLAVYATVRIPDVDRIAELLNHDRDVPQAMATAIRQEVATYLHDVRPDLFFLRFDSPPDGEAQRSVREELEQRIERVLADGFGAEVSALTCKPLPTELYDCFRLLAGKAIELRFVQERAGGQSQLPVHGSLEVLRIENSREAWLAFHRKLPTVEEVAQRAQEHLLQFLSDRDRAEARRGASGAEREDAGQYLARALRGEFGLVVRILTWRWSLPEEDLELRDRKREIRRILWDKERRELVGDPELQTKLLAGERELAVDLYAELRTLRAHRHTLLLEGGSPPEIERIQQQIERCEKERELIRDQALAPEEQVASINRLSRFLAAEPLTPPKDELGEQQGPRDGDAAPPEGEEP